MKTPSASINIWGAWRHLWAPISNLEAVDIPVTYISDIPRVLFPLRDLLISNYSQLLPDTVSGKITWCREETAKHLQAVHNKLPAEQTFLYTRRILEVLDAGNRIGRWKIILPSIPAPLPPAPSSIFQSADFELMVRNEPLFDAFINSLCTPITALQEDKRSTIVWGQILGSALLFGGLVQRPWLFAVTESLSNIEPGSRWLELWHTPRNATRPVLRRWYPDPISRQLLLNHSSSSLPPVPKGLNSRSDALMRLLRSYASFHGFEHLLPATWRDLTTVIVLRLSLYIPPDLMAYSRGIYESASLPDHVMQRLLKPHRSLKLISDKTTSQDEYLKPHSLDPSSGSSRSDDISIQEIYPSSTEDNYSESISEESYELWPHQLRELSHQIRRCKKPDPKRISHWRKNQTKSLIPSIDRLAEWIEYWLFTRRRARRALSPKTTYDFFNAIAGRLVGQLGECDPAKLGAEDDYLALYLNALEDCDLPSTRKRIARGLESFHDFLVERYSAPTIDGGTLFSAGIRVSSAVDANLIDPNSFERALQWLELQRQDSPEETNALFLIASLGFYAGLRRSEVLGLTLADLEKEPDWDLLVRPNKFRLLKSSSATRVLPLRLLLPDHHLERLKGWIQRREAELIHVHGTHRHETRLFALEGLGERSMDRRLEKITEALQMVTHDSTLRFHHLRHSFANRTLLSLWESEHLDEIQRAGWLPSLFDMADAARLRRELLGTAPVQRRTLRLVSFMMGHSGPDITLAHYIHLADYLLGRALRQSVPPLTKAQLASLAGYSIKHIERLHRDRSLPLEFLLDELTESSLMIHGKKQPPPTTSLDFVLPDAPYERAMLLIEAINHSIAPGHASSISYPWPTETISAMVEKLDKLPSGILLRKQNASGLITFPRNNKTQHSTKDTMNHLWPILTRKTSQYAERKETDDLQYLLENFPTWWAPKSILDVNLSSVRDAKVWLSFLNRIGLAHLVEIEHIAKRQSKFGSQATQLSYWEESLEEKITTSTTSTTQAGILSQRGMIHCRLLEQDTHASGLAEIRYGLVLLLLILLIE